MHFLQAINSDISVLIVCNKTGGTIKMRYNKNTMNKYVPPFDDITAYDVYLSLLQCVRKVAVHLGYGTQIWLSKSAVYRDCPRTLNELETAITAYIRDISQVDPQKVFENKIRWAQACRVH